VLEGGARWVWRERHVVLRGRGDCFVGYLRFFLWANFEL
jgi:hypothetical protein